MFAGGNAGHVIQFTGLLSDFIHYSKDTQIVKHKHADFHHNCSQ